MSRSNSTVHGRLHAKRIKSRLKALKKKDNRLARKAAVQGGEYFSPSGDTPSSASNPYGASTTSPYYASGAVVQSGDTLGTLVSDYWWLGALAFGAWYFWGDL